MYVRYCAQKSLPALLTLAALLVTWRPAHANTATFAFAPLSGAVPETLVVDLGGDVREIRSITFVASGNSVARTYECTIPGYPTSYGRLNDFMRFTIFKDNMPSPYSLTELKQDGEFAIRDQKTSNQYASLTTFFVNGIGHFTFQRTSNLSLEAFSCGLVGGGSFLVHNDGSFSLYGAHVEIDYDPLVPTEASSWGAMKALYR
jgi:hypothetical protein